MGVVGIVMGVGLALRKTELAAGLKKSMLERGMSAEEIRMVMDAGIVQVVRAPTEAACVFGDLGTDEVRPGASATLKSIPTSSSKQTGREAP